MDQRAGAHCLMPRTAQQILVAMLSTLDDTSFTTLMLPAHGKNAILEKALVAQCRMLLSYERLQMLLYDRWRFILPTQVNDYVSNAWFGEMANPEELKQAQIYESRQLSKEPRGAFRSNGPPRRACFKVLIPGSQRFARRRGGLR